MFESLNSSDQQQLVYSVLLLIFLVTTLASRREFSFAKVAKYMAIWSLIALVALGFYAYRFELQDFKNRLIAELNPTAARPNAEGQLVINLADDHHFYIDAKVNGKLVRFMIDTGASDIVINAKEAKKIGIDPKKLKFNRRYETANGAVMGAGVTLDKIEFGGAEFTDVEASVNNADMGTSLLGMSFLRKFKKYEFYQDRLVLTL